MARRITHDEMVLAHRGHIGDVYALRLAPITLPAEGLRLTLDATDPRYPNFMVRPRLDRAEMIRCAVALDVIVTGVNLLLGPEDPEPARPCRMQFEQVASRGVMNAGGLYLTAVEQANVGFRRSMTLRGGLDRGELSQIWFMAITMTNLLTDHIEEHVDR